MMESLESNIGFGIWLTHYSDTIPEIGNQPKRLSADSDERTNFFGTTLKTSSYSHTFTFTKSTSASQIILL